MNETTPEDKSGEPATTPPDDAVRAGEAARTMQGEIAKAVVGQKSVVNETLIALVAGGHVLIEGVPGLGRRLLARALARCWRGRFSGRQLPPCLMPSAGSGQAI